jgi:hypothetical protein
MPKRIKQQPRDVNQAAHVWVEASTQEPEPHPTPKPKQRKIPESVSEYMAKIGRKGGKRSGKSRLKLIDPEKRREIAANAARTRWTRAKEGIS